MRIVFMGTPDFAVPSLRALNEEGFEIVAVVTQPDRPRGRGQRLRPSPVKKIALELGLNIYQPERIKNPEFVEILQGLQPQVIVVAAFGQILSKAILDIPPKGCINVHASLLPKYRGAAPLHWAVINGEKITGVTTMLMDEGLDTGDMLLRETIEISPQMTTGEVHDCLALIGGQVLVETLHQLERGLLNPVPQNEQEATYAPLLEPRHEQIDWRQNSLQIHNLIRGLNPWPGAYTYFEGSRLKIWRSLIKDYGYHIPAAPGTILSLDREGIWIQTQDTPLLITLVQPAGKKIISARDFFNGYRLEPGQVLGG